ncbi:hypothetical protein CK489_28735 [Bradyrhizobium sp. UFLA03-84]|uniref:hypothetical protein n=1 Tax=Bradyrhizobium sp. UFLA03-84 TaxID=418599 RepID=UPI000BADD8E3|nr:hypothetical protein [Bradyrhizobium sp. UFLA03-84]PAY05379.1 hypothetical protein CK489_28735 [Bradyrhizobium sp. UFLA03-84]
MSQATITDTTSRRRFLAGTAAAVLIPTGAVAAPVSADPIFALIETHRAAAKAYGEATHEQCRREQILIDEGIGLSPFAVITWGGRPITVHSHGHIDSLKTASDRQRAKAHADLDIALRRHGEIFGDAENVADAAYQADCEALDRLISTAPTSSAGLRALVSYLVEEVEDVNTLLHGDCRVETLLVTIQEALVAGGQA